ncbi:MAG: hypothetical protein Q7S17_02345 [Xanthobacteraceae bacterium]|nr:hypothetical protein [Xanthobacteraceae bacterium]
MRCTAILIAILMSLAPASAAPPHQDKLASSETVLTWINGYRNNPDPTKVPAAVRAMSRVGAFKDPENSGVYIGFIAGVINANPALAEDIIARILPLPPEDQWVMVRAIAYSGLPEWKGLMHSFAMHMPGRQGMMERYLTGKLPILEQMAFKGDPTLLDKLKGMSGIPVVKPMTLEPTPDLLDTLWGYFFATGSYEPIARIIAMVPWSRDRNHVEKLTLGGMAKFTLAVNAARDPNLLQMLKWAARHQPAEAAPVMHEVIDAAEAVDTAKLHKQALASIEDLRRKGPGYKRDVSLWGQIGQGILSLGCVVAAATGHVELGIPCLAGGALSSAALYYGTQPD